jgi:SAM-dependent methyltransferase
VTQRCSAVIAEIHAAIERELRAIRAAAQAPLNVLDVGCWDGERTAVYRDILGGWARGVEVFPQQIDRARARGIDVASVDLEHQTLPWPDESVDVAVVNQVFEHLKNVWVPMSEIARVIVPGGLLVFSVPNLASLHNRVMLGLGLQPSSIRTFGPHIRGFTFRQARQFVEFGGFFAVQRAVGVGFYPLPARYAGWLARLWVGGSHTPILVARRRAASGARPPWRQMTTGYEIGEQTFYAAERAATSA